MMVVRGMIAIIAACDLVDNVIGDLFERDASLVIFGILGAHSFNDSHALSDFIFSDNDRKTSTAGIGSFHLRLEAAAGTGRCTMQDDIQPCITQALSDHECLQLR